MMDPLQSNLSEKDRNKLIETYGKDSKFKNLFKNIFGGGTTKKVENFLRETQPTEFMGGSEQPPTEFLAMHDYQKDPELRKNLMEIINTPGYDPDSVREAQRQIIRMNQGLPRFPEA